MNVWAVIYQLFITNNKSRNAFFFSEGNSLSTFFRFIEENTFVSFINFDKVQPLAKLDFILLYSFYYSTSINSFESWFNF